MDATLIGKPAPTNLLMRMVQDLNFEGFETTDEHEIYTDIYSGHTRAQDFFDRF
jgi:hypothetical protein